MVDTLKLVVAVPGGKWNTTTKEVQSNDRMIWVPENVGDVLRIELFSVELFTGVVIDSIDVEIKAFDDEGTELGSTSGTVTSTAPLEWDVPPNTAYFEIAITKKVLRNDSLVEVPIDSVYKPTTDVEVVRITLYSGGTEVARASLLLAAAVSSAAEYQSISITAETPEAEIDISTNNTKDYIYQWMFRIVNVAGTPGSADKVVCEILDAYKHILNKCEITPIETDNYCTLVNPEGADYIRIRLESTVPGLTVVVSVLELIKGFG